MLREVAGVCSTVSTAILFQELQVSPLDHVWWSQAVRFWEDVRRLPADHVYSWVLQDNCRDAVARVIGMGIWLLHWAPSHWLSFDDSMRYSHLSRPVHCELSY
jgi:hypothetical protein